MLKNIIAQNIAELRRNNGMTQIELAEKLNYSDTLINKILFAIDLTPVQAFQKDLSFQKPHEPYH